MVCACGETRNPSKLNQEQYANSHICILTCSFKIECNVCWQCIATGSEASSTEYEQVLTCPLPLAQSHSHSLNGGWFRCQLPPNGQLMLYATG